MNSPHTPVLRSRETPPFNLSRWFATVGLISISTIGIVCALLLSNFLTSSMLRQEGVMTMQFVQSLAQTEPTLPAYFKGEPASDPNELRLALRHMAAVPEALRANMYNRDRTVIWSTDKTLVGRRFGANPELDAALAGEVVVHPDEADDEHLRKEEHMALQKETDYFVEAYVPVRDGINGPVIGVVELYKSPQALDEALRTSRWYIFVGSALSCLFLYLTLFGLSRRADAVIREQQVRIIDSETLAALGEMASAVAHGIRNPLACIRSSAELALDGRPDDARETAQDIINEADRIEVWVRELLTYACPISATTELVSLPALVEATINSFARDMERRHISSRSLLTCDLPQARGDAMLLGQVLHSLFSNAVEAIETGGTIEITGRAVPQEKRVELTIRDSGPGMDAEQLKHMFTPFYTTKARGLGVGLSLARRIIDRLGGSIGISSVPGKGTAVCLSMSIA